MRQAIGKFLAKEPTKMDRISGVVVVLGGIGRGNCACVLVCMSRVQRSLAGTRRAHFPDMKSNPICNLFVTQARMHQGS